MSLFLRSMYHKHRLLAWAILASLVLHGFILLIRIATPPAFSLRQSDLPLEVELVNSRSQKAPKRADVLAQANLDGGGDRDQGRATTPLPAMADNHSGEIIKRLQQRNQHLTQEQRRLLTQTEISFDVHNPLMPRQHTQVSAENGKDARSIEIIRQRLEAEIAREQQLIAKRPRRTQLTASSAIAVNFAQYYDTVRRKIERYGTTNFPRVDGQPLYGSLILVLNVQQDGQLGYARDGYKIADVTVQRSSGNATLDRQAVAIARATAPFGAFTAAMRAQYDILEIIYTFNFSHGGFTATAHTAPTR